MADHDHKHDDHSHDGDTYFIDQFCMVGLSGAFGVICLCMYFWQTGMLNLLLGAQFHLFVLASGFTLVGIALFRGYLLWTTPAPAPHAHHHDHAHAGHEHDHATCGHDHSHENANEHDHATCGHDHSHDHAKHGHSHGDHDASDHDHDWAPWRYVVAMLPIMLFLLGMPNKGPQARAEDVKTQADFTQEAIEMVRIAASGTDPFVKLGAIGALLDEQEEVKVDMKTLMGWADSESLRERNAGKMVSVRGQFLMLKGTDRLFSLARFKIGCCAADAILVSIPMMSREPISGIADNDWVKVKGKVDFVPKQGGGGMMTVVTAPRSRYVEKCLPESNPYIQ